MSGVFLFLEVPAQELRIIIILLADQPDIILLTARKTDN